MISLDKKYRTKDGRPIRLYAIYEDKNMDYPVHGAVFIKGQWEIGSWTRNGSEYVNESEEGLGA